MSMFVFFDVETPNRNNDRISSAGIIVIEEGKTLLEVNYLVNPEVRFDAFNIQLTGITPYMVKDAPTFAELWPSIQKYFDEGVIVAHNATFDLGVLTQTLRHYAIDVPKFRYICTLALAKKYFRYRRNSLDYLCATLGIYLERHHEALSDARGCQGIFFKIVERFGYNEGFVSSYYKPRKPVKSSCEHVGLSSTTDEVQIRERTFCLTGDFKYGEKTDVELFIMARGGSISPQVNKQVDYLLVGDLGSPKWAYGAYGTKVKKANALRSAGVSIDIVLEKDFWQLEGR